MIWEYKEIKNQTSAVNLVSLNEGNTADLKFFDGKTEVILKREDLNPTGSWKDRGTAFKVTELINNNINEAVISSSGNAAISFLTYLKPLLDLKLHVVVSKDINQSKLEKIKELMKGTANQLYIEENPRKKSVEISAQNKCINLRASIDESIVKGYWSLGFELKKYILPDREIGLFTPVSSGTTLVGIAQGLQMKLQNDSLLPKIFAVQTQSTCPIVKQLYGIQEVEEKSYADAIIDKTALRSPQILKIIKETNGNAFAITNNELLNAENFIKEKISIALSKTSLLSVAGYLRLKSQNGKLDRAIIIASGT